MSNNLVKSRRRSGGGGGPKKPRVQFHRGFLVDFVGHPIPPLRRQRRLQETVAAVLACLSELVRPSVEFLARSLRRSSDRPENAATRSSVARPTQLEEGRAMLSSNTN